MKKDALISNGFVGLAILSGIIYLASSPDKMFMYGVGTFISSEGDWGPELARGLFLLFTAGVSGGLLCMGVVWLKATKYINLGKLTIILAFICDLLLFKESLRLMNDIYF